jgi:hypothetical protein
MAMELEGSVTDGIGSDKETLYMFGGVAFEMVAREQV